ncbi:Beta-glucanase precursor [uncultured Bacteroides sp.]|uniref:glycoside hydrolase family 16 protein n=1 Tax=Bacteroides TaxID=816 RepID=UPI000822EAF0|nr:MULTISPECIES: glycoside hydrolase family 16 protein [Bacteroides]MCR8892611.1 glycoside hydrolase family 16 protein [Bacteroides sp. ET336]MCU6772265.1 glycoside hydrolase family 16 protein [Bacteroides cellulolyticus]MDN0057107.1 glycoside hydrolase family 16 protein [Bacteroides caecigallinarum]SCI28899.1 Beta-glucanase precursor [uncultured Bacteroides sp.]
MKTVILFLLFFFGVNLQSCSTNNEPVKPDNPEEEIKDDNEGQEEEPELPDEQPGDEDEPSKQWKLVFTEDFNTFDNSVWTKETHEPGWVNNELQEYIEACVSVGKDGDKSVLILTAKKEGDKFYSGRVNSKGKKSFQYGKVEASIKLPKTANGLWPAFWMMGDNDRQWPACGEIDIMEMGEKAGIANNTTETYINTAIHYGPNVEGHEQVFQTKTMEKSLQDGNYHVYSLEWNENELIVKVDDILIKTFNIGPDSGRFEYFNDKFYLLLNLAVGGDFPGITDPAQITALKDGEKAQMFIDWVKIYN